MKKLIIVFTVSLVVITCLLLYFTLQNEIFAPKNILLIICVPVTITLATYFIDKKKQ